MNLFSDLVCIDGVDRDLLLRFLWNRATPSRYFAASFKVPKQVFDLDEVKTTVQNLAKVNDHSLYRVCGRTLYLYGFYQFSYIDATMYNSAYGPNAFQDALECALDL